MKIIKEKVPSLKENKNIPCLNCIISYRDGMKLERFKFRGLIEELKENLFEMCWVEDQKVNYLQIQKEIDNIFNSLSECGK